MGWRGGGGGGGGGEEGHCFGCFLGGGVGWWSEEKKKKIGGGEGEERVFGRVELWRRREKKFRARVRNCFFNSQISAEGEIREYGRVA